MIITITELTTTLISSHWGWAVADQFKDTFEGGEPFEEQNMNALKNIYLTVKDLIKSGLLSKQAMMELESYRHDLSMYLTGIK